MFGKSRNTTGEIKPFIDMHCHYLHEVDDGARDLKTTLEMFEIAVSEGLSHVVLTPHFQPGKYNEQDKILTQFEELISVINQKYPEMKVRLGQEIYLSEESVDAIIGKEVYMMADTNYLLIELSTLQFFPVFEAMIYQIQMQGYKIILAHVERYDYMFERPELFDIFKGRGCLMQINASAIVSHRQKKKLLQLIADGYIQFISTDCHDTHRRIPRIKEAYALIEKKFGSEKAHELFYKNAYEAFMNF
jgi:protein-tyrosine phosphatase